MPADVVPGEGVPISAAPTSAQSRQICPASFGIEEIAALLHEARFVELEERMVALHRAFEREPACEVELVEVARALAVPENLAQLDSFVAARPEAWIARALRAAAYIEIGLVRRGTAFAQYVTDDQWRGMNEAFAAAAADLQQSLTSEPANLIAVMAALAIVRQQGNQVAALQILEEALAAHPLSYSARSAAMNVFAPNYGGSYEAMAAIAEDAQAQADRNPRLRGLPAIPILIRAQIDYYAGELDRALAGYRRALAYLPHRDGYGGLCDVLFAQQRYPDVLETAEIWLAAQGEDGAARIWRGRALERLGRGAEAIAEMDRGVALMPRNTWARNSRAFVLERLGEAALAVEEYQRVLALDPGQTYAAQRVSEVLMTLPDRSDEAEAALRHWAALSPNDLQVQFLLGKLYHDLGDPRALQMLESYLERAANDGRESGRIAQAKRFLAPARERRLPALEHLGLVSSS